MSVVVMPPLHEREHPEGCRAQLRGAELCRALMLAAGVQHDPALQERGAGPAMPLWALVSWLVCSRSWKTKSAGGGEAHGRATAGGIITHNRWSFKKNRASK